MTSRMTSRARGRGTVVGAAGLVLALAGCSSGGGESASPVGEDTASPTTTTSVPVPVPEPTATVEPADGPLIRVQGATIRGLEGFRRISDFGQVQGYRNDQASVTLSYGFTGTTSLDAFAREELAVVTVPGTLERVDNVVVGGEYNAFHMLDTSDPEQEAHRYGVMFLNGSWIIRIGFYTEKVGNAPVLTSEEREEALASILATFETVSN